MDTEDKYTALSFFFKELNKTSADIAEEVGMSRQQVENLLKNRCAFRENAARKFSECYGLSPSWLMTGTGSMLLNRVDNVDFAGKGERLELFLKKRGLSKLEAGRLALIAPSYMSDMTTGRLNISRNYAERLSSALGVSAAWLLTGEGEMEVEGWTPPAELPAAPARVRNTDGGSSTKLADLRRENAELRAEVERLRGQVSQLLSVVQNLTGGKTEQ